MHALRILKNPENGLITFSLPDDFKYHKAVEIIVLPVEEKVPAKKTNLKQFRGLWKNTELNALEISTEMRDEWERNI